MTRNGSAGRAGRIVCEMFLMVLAIGVTACTKKDADQTVPEADTPLVATANLDTSKVLTRPVSDSLDSYPEFSGPKTNAYRQSREWISAGASGIP